MATVEELALRLGIAPTCHALGLPRATYYRGQTPRRPPRPRRAPRALAPPERQAVLDVLHEDRFVDLAPAEVYGALLDEGRYLCSERTMYRVLAAHQEVRERRDQRRHPVYAAPELLATQPNQVWSWDITKLLGPQKWTYYYLYVVLDVFSRYVVAWLVALREAHELAQQLLAEAYTRQGIQPGQLTVHADRGSSMKSKPVGLLLTDLGVTKSHSRPHTPSDNPYSEAQFKTLKYRPGFPARFGAPAHARAVCGDLFLWYNHEHRHSGLGLLTPADVHCGRAAAKTAQRAEVLTAAYRAHPERFPRGVPQPPMAPSAVWINKPKTGPTGLLGGGPVENDARECPTSDDRDPGTDPPTPGFRQPELVVAVQ